MDKKGLAVALAIFSAATGTVGLAAYSAGETLHAVMALGLTALWVLIGASVWVKQILSARPLAPTWQAGSKSRGQ
jgi:hypothetical protein